MRFIKYLCTLMLIALLALIFELTPAVAGEHPWQEDPLVDTLVQACEIEDTVGSQNQGIASYDDYQGIGTPYLWFEIVVSHFVKAPVQQSALNVSESKKPKGEIQTLR